MTLPPLDLEDRRDSLRLRLGELEVDRMVLVSREDVRWATGFTGSAGLVVVGPDGPTLVTDGRYAEQAEAQCPTTRIVVHDGGVWACVAGVVGGGRAAIDPAHVTLAEWEGIRGFGGIEWRTAPGLLATLRRTKRACEIARISAAAAFADAALSTVVADGVVGATEREVRDALEATMRRAGADGPSYDTIVASGPNAARPHHRPSHRTIEEGDAVVIDVGALVDGYHSDMTRTLLVGEPDDELAETHRLVVEAQAAGVARVRAGVAAAEVDEACRAVFRAAGREGDVVHGTGHGVGLLIHESPWLRRGSADVLAEGDVLTVEPGLYRVGRDGVRIEDLVVVTADGCRTLTLSTKDPTCPQSRQTT